MRSVPVAGGPRRAFQAWLARSTRVAGRALAVITVMVVAVAFGFAAAVATGAVSVRPAVFLSADLLVTSMTGAAGLWLVLRTLPVRDRLGGTAIMLAVLLLTVAAAFLAPLRDPRAPYPVPNQSTWHLPTGSRLAYVKLPGAAPKQATPIVVLHGGPGVPDMAGDAAYFGHLTRLGFDVYLYDQLGSGNSARLADPGGYGIARDTADLEEIRRTIGANRIVLIGHSYGGALAAHYLAAHPTHVERMILISPGPLNPADRSADGAAAGLDTGAKLRTYAKALAPRALLGYTLLQVNPAAAHAYLDDAEADARNDAILTIAEPALHCSPAQGHGSVRGSGFYALQYPQSAAAPTPTDVRPALTGQPTPTLVIKGSCDYLSWQSAVDYRRALPNTTLLYLTGAGHNTHQDRPADVMAAAQAFLADRPLPFAPYLPDTQPSTYSGPP